LKMKRIILLKPFEILYKKAIWSPEHL